MLDQFLDHNFLSALATVIGPLAVFVAPTEEIEAMIFDSHVADQAATSEPLAIEEVEFQAAEGYRNAA